MISRTVMITAAKAKATARIIKLPAMLLSDPIRYLLIIMT